MAPDAKFSVVVRRDERPGETLIVGLSHIGMAGLTASDYLVRHVESERIGHVSPDGLPALAPFEDGSPRHHTRLYNLVDTDLSVLVGEMFYPVWATPGFADALLEWATEHGVREIAVLHGVPFPHGPEEHAVFSVATDAYRDRRLGGESIRPLAGGFLDGAAGEFVTRAIDGGMPPVGVFVTPTHPPGPDVDAALLLLDAVESIYSIEVDESELRRLSQELQRYYAGLADRMRSLGEADQPLSSRDYPEDRMYM